MTQEDILKMLTTDQGRQLLMPTLDSSLTQAGLTQTEMTAFKCKYFNKDSKNEAMRITGLSAEELDKSIDNAELKAKTFFKLS